MRRTVVLTEEEDARLAALVNMEPGDYGGRTGGIRRAIELAEYHLAEHPEDRIVVGGDEPEEERDTEIQR